MNYPSFAQNNSLETKPKLIKADVNKLSNLLLSWEFENKHIKKAELAKKIQKNYFHEYNTTLNGMIKNHKIDANEFLEYVHDIDINFFF